MGKQRKVAIIGTAPSSFQLAPWEDTEWEIWCTSRSYTQGIPRWDLWFEVHNLDRLGRGWQCDEATKKQNRAEHIEWMSKQQQPIYLQKLDDRIPAGLEFPLGDVLACLKEKHNAPEPYLRSSIAHIIAFAIYQQVDEIGIWGVDMALQSEYEYERASCEYLIGLARGAGIPVTIPKESDLVKAVSIYGYTDDTPFEAKMKARAKELETRKQQAKEQRQQQVHEHGMLVGRVAFAQEMIAGHDNPDAPLKLPDNVYAEITALAQQWQGGAAQIDANIRILDQQIASFRGALEDNQYIQQSWL